MIEIEGQFKFGAQVRGRDLIIDPFYLHNFVLRQQARNNLPQVKIELSVEDEDVLPYLNEGQAVTITQGIDVNDLDSYEIFLTDVRLVPSGQGRYRARLEGLLNRPEYVVRRRQRVTDGPLSSLETMLRVAAPYFEVRSNRQRSADRQVWVQPSVPDSHFISDLWRHSYLPDSWLAVAIKAVGPEFRVFSMEAVAGDFEPWVFGNIPDAIPYQPSTNSRLTSAAWNQFAGYASFDFALDLDSGEGVRLDQQVVPSRAAIAQLNRHPALRDPRLNRVFMRTVNHHPRYHGAQQDNYSWAAVNSSFRMELLVTEGYRDVAPLDSAFLFVPSNAGSGSQSTFHSGFFIVDTVVHRIRDQQYSMTVVLSREAPGDLEGDF